jgi:hypothetical protein
LDELIIVKGVGAGLVPAQKNVFNTRAGTRPAPTNAKQKNIYITNNLQIDCFFIVLTLAIFEKCDIIEQLIIIKTEGRLENERKSRKNRK